VLRRETLINNAREIDLEIRRRCIAIGLDCKNEREVQQLARDVLWNMSALHRAAIGGNVPARVKVELYALTMLIHKINTDTLGPFYLAQFDAVLRLESSWVVIAGAIWKELDSSDNSGSE